jgi:two-component system, response regulator PdtaR
MAYRLLIVGEEFNTGSLASMLEDAGYRDVRQACNKETALSVLSSLTPEVVLVDMDLQGDDAVSLIKDILQRGPVPVIVHASYNHIEKVKDAEALGASAYIFRPLGKENLLGAIELGISRFRQCQALHVELGDCKEALRVRKLVERAKGIMMARSKMTEEEAFLKLQKLSRDNNIPMEKVAQSIITASELI